MFKKSSVQFILLFIILLNCSPQKKKYDQEDVNLKFRSHGSETEPDKGIKRKEPIDFNYKWISPINIDYRKYEKNSPLEILLQNGHTDSIIDIAVSPDGRFIVTSSEDRTIKIWTMEGTLLKTIPVYGKYIYNLTFLPDGTGFAASLAEGERMSSSLAGKSVRIWDINGRVIKNYEGKNYNLALMAYSPDGKNIATSFGYGAKTFDIRDSDFNIIKTVAAPHRGIYSLAYSPDGRYIATGGSSFTTEAGFEASAVLWSGNGEYIRDLNTAKPPAIGGDENRKARKEKIKKSNAEDVKWITFSPDGKFLILVDGSSIIDVRTPEGEKKLSLKISFPKRAYFTPDSSMIIASGSHDTRIFSIDGSELGSKYLRSKEEPGLNVSCSAISPDGRSLLTGFDIKNTGIVRIWDLNGNLMRELGTNSIEFKRVVLSPDSNRLIIERPDADRNLYDGTFIWHINNNRIDMINERIGFKSNEEEFRFFYNIVTHPFRGSEARKRRLEEQGKSLEKQNRGNIFIIRDKKREWEFKTGYGTGLIPLYDGTVARWGSGGVTFFDIEGNPLKKIKIKGGDIKGIGGIDDYGTAFSPDMKYFIIETDTYHGGLHGLGLVDMNGKQIARYLLDSELLTAAIGPGGALIATGHKNGDIQIMTREGKILKKLKGHLVDIKGIAFDKSGKFLVSASKDRTVRIWNIVTGEYITLVVYESGDWVVFNDKGYFDCSDGGRRYVKFIKGLSVYGFQQFWSEYFVPGLIANLMGNRKIRSEDIAVKINRTPSVTIRRATGGGEKSDPSRASVTVCAESRGGGVGNIFLIHNGRAIDEMSRGLQVVARGGCRIFDVDLLHGENTLAGAAYDGENTAYGKSDDLAVFFRPDKTTMPDMHILAVGISGYMDRNLMLMSPADDARAVSVAFKSAGSSLYENIHTYVLTDKKAGKNDILSTLELVLKKAKKIDTVILFFAGHGDVEGGIYYYLAYDTDVTDLKKTGLSINEISRFIRSIPANKIAVFFDTCRSGGAAEIFSKFALERGYDDVKIMANLAKERGIAVFSAAGSSKSAFEIKSLGHGIFTYCILDALNNKREEIADNSLISIARLLSYVNRMTRDVAQKYLNIEQSPILYIFGDDFSIGRNR